MNPYFAFSDECGLYQKNRSDRSKQAHPFYVRSTLIISLDDYILLQEGIDSIKASFGILPSVEIKWAHFGSALKNNYKNIPHTLTPTQLKEYFSQCLLLLCSLKSAVVYYTFTDNVAIGQVGEIGLIKMHLQNALQKVQAVVSEKDGYAIFVADDLNDKSKALKEAVYQMTLAGDYVQYTNIKKGLYIDFSDQCHGLQMADICAGVFTASLKYERANEKEKCKYQTGHDLFFDHAYKKIRSSFFNPPYYDVYRFGVKNVPNHSGESLAKSISRKIESYLERDLMKEIHEMFAD